MLDIVTIEATTDGEISVVSVDESGVLGFKVAAAASAAASATSAAAAAVSAAAAEASAAGLVQISFIATIAAGSSTNLAGRNSCIVERVSTSAAYYPMLFVRVAASPGHSLAFQDSTGAWFEIADRKVSPLHFGAADDSTADATAAVQAMLDFVRARFDASSTTFTFEAWLAGRTWATTAALYLTNLRQYGFTISGGAIHGKGAGTTVLDLSGTAGVQFRDVTIVGDGTSTPQTGLLIQRASLSGAFGGAGRHDMTGLTIRGSFVRACLVNYGSEENRYPYWMSNRYDSRSAYVLVIVSDDAFLSKYGISNASNVTPATGAQSTMNHLFPYGINYQRQTAISGLTISAISKASPGRVTLASATTAISDGAPVWFFTIAGMTELNGSVAYLKKITDTTYDLYTDAGLTTARDTSGYTTFTSGALWSANAAAIVIGGGVSNISAPGGYVTAYGAAHIRLDSQLSGTSSMNNVKFGPLQCEPNSLYPIQYDTPDSATVEHFDHDWTIVNKNMVMYTAVVRGNQYGTGKIKLSGASKLRVVAWGTAPTAVFLAPTCFEPNGLSVAIPTRAPMNAPSAFNARFVGSVEAYDDGEVVTYDDIKTWTPTLAFGGASSGIAYGTRLGWYERRGQIIRANFRIVLTSKGSSTGAVTITGLPAAADGTTGYYGGGAVPVVAALATLYGAVSADVNTGSTTIRLYHTGAAAAGQLTDANFTNTSTLNGYVEYRAAD